METKIVKRNSQEHISLINFRHQNTVNGIRGLYGWITWIEVLEEFGGFNPITGKYFEYSLLVYTRF